MTYNDQEFYLYFVSRPHFVQSCSNVLILLLKSSKGDDADKVMLSSTLPHLSKKLLNAVIFKSVYFQPYEQCFFDWMINFCLIVRKYLSIFDNLGANLLFICYWTNICWCLLNQNKKIFYVNTIVSPLIQIDNDSYCITFCSQPFSK